MIEGQGPSPAIRGEGVTMGYAPSPSERVAIDGAFSAHPHGSGTGVGSGAGGRTSSPELRLERRLFTTTAMNETSDEQMMSYSPLGESSRHDGSHGTCRPHGGHHDVVSCPIGVIANGNDGHAASFPSSYDFTDDWGQGGDHRHFGEEKGRRPEERTARDHVIHDAHVVMPLGRRQSVGQEPHDIGHDSHDQCVSVSARVRDCRGDHRMCEKIGEEIGEEHQRNEDRDLPLRVGDPAVISAAVATSL